MIIVKPDGKEKSAILSIPDSSGSCCSLWCWWWWYSHVTQGDIKQLSKGSTDLSNSAKLKMVLRSLKELESYRYMLPSSCWC